MTPTAPAALAENVMTIEQETRVKASLETTFAALLDHLGASFTAPDGTSMQFKLEAFPGGRWYRDLGDGNGHCWGTVQAIKRPTLLELSGPLMMSVAIANNVQYRLSEAGGETVIQFHHYAFGTIPAGDRENKVKGWAMIADRVKQSAESKAKQ